MAIRGSPIARLNHGRSMSLKRLMAHDYACAFDGDQVDQILQDRRVSIGAC